MLFLKIERGIDNMLRLNGINVSYDQLVFKDARFTCAYHKITVVLGESGSGKSTLLDIIALNIGGYQSYTINDEVVNHKVLSGHIYYGKQEPLFENDLTVRENIDLFYTLYHVKKNEVLEKKLLNEVGLNQSLDMYPQMLSEGEKKRLSLLLAIFSQRDIVLLDEPTASVDEELRTRIIKLIKKYLSSRMTIVTTHDHDLIDIADNVYKIDHCQLKMKNNIEDQEWSFQPVKKYNVLSYYWNTLKHRKFYAVFNFILTSLIVSGAVVGLFSTHSYLDSYQKQLAIVSSYEFIVYEPLMEGRSYSGDEYPLSQEIVKQLNQLSYINKIRPFYCFTTYDIGKLELNGTMISHDDDFIIQYVSYDDSKDNSEYLQENFSTGGIYLSADLAKYIGNVQEGDSLTFEMPVPQYNVFNDGYIMDDNGEPLSYLVYPKDHYVDETLPISGIEKNELMHMGISISLNSNIIYVPQSYMEEQIKKNQVSESYDEGSIEYKPYMPNAYIISLSSIEDIPQLKNDIHQMNLSVDSHYIDVTSYIQQEKLIQQSQKIITIGIIVVLLIIMFIMKYLKKKEDIYFFTYLQYLTNDKDYVRKTYQRSLLYKVVITFLLSIIFTCIFVFILSQTIIQGLSISFLSVFICLILSVIIEIMTSLFVQSKGIS